MGCMSMAMTLALCSHTQNGDNKWINRLEKASKSVMYAEWLRTNKRSSIHIYWFGLWWDFKSKSQYRWNLAKRCSPWYSAAVSIFLTIGWQIIYRFSAFFPYFRHSCCCYYLRTTSDSYTISSFFFLFFFFSLLAAFGMLHWSFMQLEHSTYRMLKKKHGKIHTLEARITHSIARCAYMLWTLWGVLRIYTYIILFRW